MYGIMVMVMVMVVVVVMIGERERVGEGGRKRQQSAIIIRSVLIRIELQLVNMRLYVIRHADPDYATDSITSDGVAQAEQLAHLLIEVRERERERDR